MNQVPERVVCLSAEAATAVEYAVDLERVSFKGSLDAMRVYSAALAQARSKKRCRQLWD